LLAISRILTRILLVAELLLKKRERYPDRLHSPPGGVQSVLYQHEPLGRGLRDAAAAFSSNFAFRSVERVFETDQRLTLPVDGPDRFLKHWERPSCLIGFVAVTTGNVTGIRSRNAGPLGALFVVE
jgi:hypothetical protein